MSTSVSSSTDNSTATDATGLQHYYGLASGLDVDSIVKGLMTNDQLKIDAAQQKQQTLLWKQEAYQNITTELRTFLSTYLSFSGSSTMLSSSTYCSYSGISSDPSLSVSGNSGAAPGTHQIKVFQSEISQAVTGAQISEKIKGSVNTNSVDLSGTSFYVTVDDVTKQISFGTGETSANLNQKLADAFGKEPDGNCKVTASIDGNGIVSIDTDSNYNPEVTMASADKNDALAKLGISSGASNRIDTVNSTLWQIFGNRITPSADGTFNVSINGTSVSLSMNDTLAQSFNKINSSTAGVSAAYDEATGKVAITSTVGGVAGGVALDDGATGFFNALLGTAEQRQTATGRDAIISIDGNMVSRSSNDFTVSGISYSIKSKVDYNANPSTIQVNLSANTDAAVTNIGKFVDAYNKLVTDMYNKVNEESANTTNVNNNGVLYKPLTDAQKAKMTDDEITKWNDKAKQGVIFGDETVMNIVDAMRDTVDSTVTTSSGHTMSLSSIGITMGDASENGQLHVDTAKLKTALQSNPNDVMELFNKSSDVPYSPKGDNRDVRTASEGLCYRIQDIANDAAGVSSGSLLEIAGMPNEATEKDNSIYKQLKDVTDMLSRLQTQFTSDQKRYYNQFTQLESYMSVMNTQSSYLSSMLGGSSK